MAGFPCPAGYAIIDAFPDSVVTGPSLMGEESREMSTDRAMRRIAIAIGLMLWLPFTAFSLNVDVRCFDYPDHTRLVFEGDRSFAYSVSSREDGFELRLQEAARTDAEDIQLAQSRCVERVIVLPRHDGTVYRVATRTPVRMQRQFVLENPFRVVFDLEAAPAVVSALPPVLQDKSQPPPLQPDGVRITTVCIDPGHGGSDLGAKGVTTDLVEKDITLKVGLKLKQLIESRLGLRVVMTRDSDSEVSLDSRAAMANNQKAQVFVSIHVNSSYRRGARGTETFYVSLEATDQEASELARKENTSMGGEAFESTASDDLRLILWNMAQMEYIKESSKLATFIQNQLNEVMNTRNRGVKQAPFRVLMRAAMPAVLVEIAFLSNPQEEALLARDGFLTRVAGAVYTGIAQFITYHNQRFK